MARDYEAELTAAQEKVERIRKAKEAHEQRRFLPIGKVAVEVFGSEIADMKVKELKEYFRSLLPDKVQPVPAVEQEPVVASGQSYGVADTDDLVE